MDSKKPAGHAEPPAPGGASWLHSIFYFYNPNLVWLLVAVTCYFFFPYDIDGAAVLSLPWLMQRFAVHFAFTFAYYAYWFASLYVFGFSQRKFNPSLKGPPFSRRLHNLFYWTLGVFQAACWEAAYVSCLARGTLPFDSTKDVLAAPILAAPLTLASWSAVGNGALLRFVVGVLGVPLWRDLHFYVAHRLLHYRPLYRFVHSLHHRNTDIEPFSGLCMHPVEHLYYYSCIAPSVLFRLHPFEFCWNLVHLLISPAASHSGWEDHFQSDVYHYLHHRFFECNYGTSGTKFDSRLGTHRSSLARSTTSYKGAAPHADPPAPRSGYNFLPATWQDALYWIFTATLSVMAGATIARYTMGSHADDMIFHTHNVTPLGDTSLPSVPGGSFGDQALFGVRTVWAKAGRVGGSLPPSLFGLVVGVGPIIAAALGTLLLKDRRPLLWPFHKESYAVLLFHFVLGWCVAVGPTVALAAAAAGGVPVGVPLWGGRVVSPVPM